MSDTLVVRVAEIDVDPDQREAFISAVKEEIDEAVRLEPGVLAIYAVAEKDDPYRMRFFEIYASEAAYKAADDHDRGADQVPDEHRADGPIPSVDRDGPDPTQLEGGLASCRRGGQRLIADREGDLPSDVAIS